MPPAWQVGPNRKVPLLVCKWYTEEGRFIQEHGTLDDSKLRAMLKLVPPDKAEKLRAEGQTHTIEELTEYATQLSMLRALLAHTPSPLI